MLLVSTLDFLTCASSFVQRWLAYQCNDVLHISKHKSILWLTQLLDKTLCYFHFKLAIGNGIQPYVVTGTQAVNLHLNRPPRLRHYLSYNCECVSTDVTGWIGMNLLVS